VRALVLQHLREDVPSEPPPVESNASLAGWSLSTAGLGWLVRGSVIARAAHRSGFPRPVLIAWGGKTDFRVNCALDTQRMQMSLFLICGAGGFTNIASPP
jgi:hypothetical protein